MTEKEYIIQHFEERFGSRKGCRIALYPGEYLEEIVRNFDRTYRFHRILEPDCAQVPPDTDLVILTDRRDGKEPDHNRICGSCREQGVPLLDLFGLDQYELHRELKGQRYLTIEQWKDLLSGYDVVSLLSAFVVLDYYKQEDRWVIRDRFRILYDWMLERGKTVLFLWDDEEQAEPLRAEGICDERQLVRRTGNDQGFLRLAARYRGRKFIHIGVGTVRDGIIPREYGLDSRLFRFYSKSVSTAGSGEGNFADRARVLEEIDRHDIISFDVFDTLLKRTVLWPRDVFGIVEEQTGIEGFADNRYEIQTACPQFSLDEIYDSLRERCGYDGRTAETLRRTELQTETAVILPRAGVVELYEHARKKGKTVILTSDMYLPDGFLRELLENNGITGYSALYVSCQFGMLKHEGLFGEVLKRCGSGRTVLHIGDDPFSDCVSAREAGLDAFYVPGCRDMAVKNGYEEAVRMCRSLTDRKLLGLSIALGFDDPFGLDPDTCIADMVVAPLTIGYLQWAAGRLAEKDCGLFLLSSRDGWLLLDAYRRLSRRYPGQLPACRYFYTSRHAAFLTVMDDPEQVRQSVDLSDYEDDPPGLLRRQFCLPADQLQPWRGESAEEYYHMHEPQIRAAAGKFRENYRRYLQQEGIEGKKCALMDLFAMGRTQMMLEEHAADEMDGYYVGAPQYVYGHARNIRYYFDEDLIDFNTEMKIEVYFTSMEPALDHIDEQGRPVFAEEVRNRTFMDRIEKIHERVRQYQQLYLDHVYVPGEVVDKELILELCNTVGRYEVENQYYDDMSGRVIETRP